MNERQTRELLEQLEELHLSHIRENCQAFAKNAAKDGLPHLDYLHRLVAGECAERFGRLVERRVRQARMPVIKTLDQFNWERPRKINRPLVESLFSLDFIREKNNVVFIGGVGVGKTHLTLALANAACVAGYSVRFTSAVNIVNHLSVAQKAGRLAQELRSYKAPSLLCIDEIGFIPFDRTAADLLYQVIDGRYEHGSVIVTTNRLYTEWSVTFHNDAVFTTALLDRLLHHSHTVIIEGESDRMRQKRAREEATL
ncbi:MAG: IS21-like element helper ATPase IstB [Kiritimatiellia bacterium]